MARKSLPSKTKSHNALSADDFQKQLLNWFQDRGLLTDLQAHLRHQMIVALRDTSLQINSAGSFHQAGSPKLQAINLLVAEFLMRHQCHYTLSVFTSEVPLLRNLPEFSSVTQSVTPGIDSASPEEFPGFHERDVFDILEALGFPSNSEESKHINDFYERSQGESLLTCIIRSLSNKNKTEHGTQNVAQEQRSLNVTSNQALLQKLPLFNEDICTLLLESNLDAEWITLLYNCVKRITEDEVQKTRKKEEVKYRQELIERERRIQEVWSRHDVELQEIRRKSDEKLNEERYKLKEQLDKKEAHFSVLASELKEQQQVVATQLDYIQDRSNLVDRKEEELKLFKRESEEYLNKKEQELHEKEKLLKEQLSRLEAETKAREQEKMELQANRIEIEAASKAIKESQSQIALLQEMQKEHSSQLKETRENTPLSHKTEEPKNTSEEVAKVEFISKSIQTDRNESKGAIPKRNNAHQQTSRVSHETQALQTQISASDLEEIFMQLHQQSAETERQRSQHTMLGNLVDQLQQENLELRGHIEQQRQRIQELTTQAAEYMQQLNSAHHTITRLRNHPSSAERQYGLQTSPRSSIESPTAPVAAAPAGASAAAVPPTIPVMDSVPGLALGAYGYHSPAAPPPPRPVSETRPPSRGFVRSSQVGAGEESYFSRRLPPESFVPLYTSPNHREQRKKPPRRLMVHSVSSSDDSCPSPTEEMLREARRRLRRLEEETAAIDRNYQEFRLRRADSLTNTASILFQPIPLSRDYNMNFTLPTQQNVQNRNAGQTSRTFPVPAPYNRSKSFISRLGILNQFPSTTILQPGVMQPNPVYPLPKTNDSLRQSFSFTSSQVPISQAASSLYPAATDGFSGRPPNSQITSSAATVQRRPSFHETPVQDGNTIAPSNERTNKMLHMPSVSRKEAQYCEGKELFQSDNSQGNASSSRWGEQLPSCVPHESVAGATPKERSVNDSRSHNEEDTPVVYLLKDSQLAKMHCKGSVESLEHPLNLSIAGGSQTFNIPDNVSLESASEENVGESLLSPHLKLLATTDNESDLHSTRSCTKLQAKFSHDIKISFKESDVSNSCAVPKQDSCHSIMPGPAPSSGEPEVSLKTTNLELKNTIRENTSLKDGKDSKKLLDKEENETKSAEKILISNEKENKLQNTKEIDPIELKSKNPIKTNELNSVQNGSSESVHTGDKKKSNSRESEEKITEPEVKSDLNEVSGVLREIHEQLVISGESNHIEQESRSLSLPSTLGSSNDLGSDIVSAGEDLSVGERKDDDIW